MPRKPEPPVIKTCLSVLDMVIKFEIGVMSLGEGGMVGRLLVGLSFIGGSTWTLTWVLRVLRGDHLPWSANPIRNQKSHQLDHPTFIRKSVCSATI